jgi:uncharacterized membrane protein (UPF0127 family)
MAGPAQVPCRSDVATSVFQEQEKTSKSNCVEQVSQSLQYQDQERIESELMNFPGSILASIRRRLARRRTNPDQRLRVLNLTRRTVLANCAEVADKGEKRRKGLLGRAALAPGEGLGILPCEAVHTFGMRFAIDLVYLDRKHRVKKIKCNVPPWRLSACLTAHSTLELAAGSIRATQTRPGDQLEICCLPVVERVGMLFFERCIPTATAHHALYTSGHTALLDASRKLFIYNKADEPRKWSLACFK